MNEKLTTTKKIQLHIISAIAFALIFMFVNGDGSNLEGFDRAMIAFLFIMSQIFTGLMLNDT